MNENIKKNLENLSLEIDYGIRYFILTEIPVEGNLNVAMQKLHEALMLVELSLEMIKSLEGDKPEELLSDQTEHEYIEAPPDIVDPSIVDINKDNSDVIHLKYLKKGIKQLYRKAIMIRAQNKLKYNTGDDIYLIPGIYNNIASASISLATAAYWVENTLYVIRNTNRHSSK